MVLTLWLQLQCYSTFKVITGVHLCIVCIVPFHPDVYMCIELGMPYKTLNLLIGLLDEKKGSSLSWKTCKWNSGFE